MRTISGAALKGPSPAEVLPAGKLSDPVLQDILRWLDDAKAEEIVAIDLEGKSTLGDYMVVASGRTDRHVGAIAEQLRDKLKELGLVQIRVEGLQACDWVVIDAGDIIVHVFRPEVREFYNLEKMWMADRPPDQTH